MSPGPRILVVDDEPMLRASLRRLLERAGYQVTTAGSGAEALAALAQAPVEMVISDLNMPGQSGLELLAEVKRRWPDTLRLVLTAAVDPALMQAIGNCDVHRCICKPWDNEDLTKLLAQLFAAFGGRHAHAG